MKLILVEVNPEDLFKTNCDIISPCALGGAINQSNQNQLKCKAIVGAANNQLENPTIAEWLLKNKLYIHPITLLILVE